jgi:hypothetical protein
VHFGVAWSEDCDWPNIGCHKVRFAVIDLEGQVIAEFVIPGSELWRPDHAYRTD